MTQSQTDAVLLMAYGTPESLDDVEAYFTHIRGGRTPSPEAIEHLRHRYALVGGRTPLLEMTRRVCAALQQALDEQRADARVYMGMKHWHPFIGDVVQTMARDGIERVVAIALAPHYSRISIGGYRKAIDAANDALETPLEITMVDSWHLQPEFLDLIASRITDALRTFPEDVRDETVVVFSAHSLPVRIREWNDPYEAQLLESSKAVAERLGLRQWRFAWQSAGSTGEPWIGPDICDYLETLHAEGVRSVLSVAIGFLADHLEIMYDLDHEARTRAESLGIAYRRTAMPNDDPALIRALAAIVLSARAAAP